ncbi:MAG: hypothetical protein J6K28_00825 [Alistipes sp.]|nr:hypothetical protein [Alistipes sp.]
MLLLAYAVVASLVVYASIKASCYIDMIDRTTKLSGAFLGGVLLSAVTSLPELFTSLSATVFLDKPELCIGNILGSDLFNIAMLSVVMLFCIRSAGRMAIARGNILVACYLVAIYGIMLLDYKGIIDFGIGGINIITFLFIGIYALAVRHLSEGNAEPSECAAEEVSLSPKAIAVRFIIASIAIIALSIVLTYITDDIATEYSLGKGLAGALFLGVATSLPEVSSTIALFRIKNYDIAVGNIVGSNLFNFLVLCIADIIGFRSSVYVYDDAKIVGLLVFGAVAALITLPLLTVRNKWVRIVCGAGIAACYVAFLVS